MDTTRRNFLFFLLLEITLLLTLTAYNSTRQRFHRLGLRSLRNTNRKPYLASQTHPSACCSEDRKYPKSYFGSFELRAHEMAIIRRHSALVIRNFVPNSWRIEKLRHGLCLLLTTLGDGGRGQVLSTVADRRQSQVSCTRRPALYIQRDGRKLRLH